MDVIIDVQNISKRYRIGIKEKIPENFASMMVGFFTQPLKNYRKYRSLYKFEDINPDDDGDADGPDSDIIWALKNVSFSVKEGELCGIIGRNGAGKSTLLKILSRVTDPTDGFAKLHGRVSSLLEVGTGFHPELTGRDNIYLNGTVLGMRKKDIDNKFDEIVDFSEVGKFLDTPVKRYSSGMRVRLAFSVAAHLEPEILIVDEVLAVGDVAFQKKCLGKMNEVTKGGRTVLFVSHNMSMISELCNKCIMLEQGKVVEIGETKEVISSYISTGHTVGSVDLTSWQIDRRKTGPMSTLYVNTKNESGQVQSQFVFREPITFTIGISGRPKSECIIGVSIRDPFGRLILHFSNIDDKAKLVLPSGESEVCMRLQDNILNDGTYYVTIFLGDGFNIENDYVYNCVAFTVDSTIDGRVVCNSPIRLPATWDISKINQP